jgi:hypothetical protein
MNTISKFWRWFTTPHIIAEWKWEGDDLRDLPCAAWRDFRRAIRDPIIRFLAGDDLVIVGDIYSSTTGPAPAYVPANRGAVVIGNFSAHDGLAVIVPRGCKPPVPTFRAVRNGDLCYPDTWIIGGAGPAMVYGSAPQVGEGGIVSDHTTWADVAMNAIFLIPVCLLIWSLRR